MTQPLPPLLPPPVPSRRDLRPWWRAGAVLSAAATIVACGVGVGMAVTAGGSGSPMGRPGASTPTTGPHPKTGRPGRRTVDPARQAWAHKYGVNRQTMPNLAPVASATTAQRAAATALLDATERATAKYADLATAKAAGFDLPAGLARAEKKKPGLAAQLRRIDAGTMPATGRMPMLHVGNAANRTDGKVLDPDAPETLMYEYTGPGAWKLIGVMYTANEAYPKAPPDPGGPITRWHYHPAAGGQSLMMHVFFVPDLAHAYAAELS